MDAIIPLLTDPAAWAALATLIAMEVVLGIDNLIFISILTNKLPEQQRATARRLGISAAVVLRLAMLSLLTLIMALTQPVFTAFGHDFTWRDLILIMGGLFLVWKATSEIHEKIDPDPAPGVFNTKAATLTMGSAILQILLLDLVFSVDSLLTAVGMTEHIPIMVVAILVSVACMMLAAGPLANFVGANPSVLMLALGFLLMIGMVLIADGFGLHIPRGYIYAAMAFSALIEGLNLAAKRAKARRAQAAS
jgi:predicted tellurium resistance membrane protein TerC